MKPIRPIRIEGDVAYVTLTKGYVAIIDAADVSLVDGWNWYAQPSGHTAYAMRTFQYDGRSRGIIMHREIMDSPPHMQVDHINGNGLDNRRENLRLATVAQNQHNQGLSIKNTSGFKGVSWHKATGGWQAKIKFEGKRIWLGSYDTPEEAAAAYAAASEKFHGEFGRLE
jgi:hypothetical protein